MQEKLENLIYPIGNPEAKEKVNLLATKKQTVSMTTQDRSQKL